MSIPRRRLIRPAPETIPTPKRLRQTQKLRERLEHERATLARWQTRLKRAFNSVEKSQRRITRFEKQLIHLEE